MDADAASRAISRRTLAAAVASANGPVHAPAGACALGSAPPLRPVAFLCFVSRSSIYKLLDAEPAGACRAHGKPADRGARHAGVLRDPHPRAHPPGRPPLARLHPHPLRDQPRHAHMPPARRCLRRWRCRRHSGPCSGCTLRCCAVKCVSVSGMLRAVAAGACSAAASAAVVPVACMLAWRCTATWCDGGHTSAGSRSLVPVHKPGSAAGKA